AGADEADAVELVAADELRGAARVLLVGAELEQHLLVVAHAPLVADALGAHTLGVERSQVPAAEHAARRPAVGQPVLDDRPRRADRAVLRQAQVLDEPQRLARLGLVAAEVLQRPAVGHQLPAVVLAAHLHADVVEARQVVDRGRRGGRGGGGHLGRRRSGGQGSEEQESVTPHGRASGAGKKTDAGAGRTSWRLDRPKAARGITWFDGYAGRAGSRREAEERAAGKQAGQALA